MGLSWDEGSTAKGYVCMNWETGQILPKLSNFQHLERHAWLNFSHQSPITISEF
jgi:hypothetical protein